MSNFKYSVLMYVSTEDGKYECELEFSHDAKLQAGDVLYCDEFDEIVISKVAWHLEHGNEAHLVIDDFFSRWTTHDDINALSPSLFSKVRGPWVETLKETPCDRS